jgi:hypothetical protein
VRRVTRDEAEIAIACLRDYGFAARIVEVNTPNDPLAPRGSSRAA